MARNQIQTTEKALELLCSPQLGTTDLVPFEESLFLDIGCGTGYSSHVILAQQTRVIGLDFSQDMLKHCSPDFNLLLIHGDMRHLPFRSAQFTYAISISAFNFASSGAKSKADLKKLIQQAIHDLEQSLKIPSRVIIEFYPTKMEEDTFLECLKFSKFQGGLFIQDPQTKKEKKFLMLSLS